MLSIQTQTRGNIYQTCMPFFVYLIRSTTSSRPTAYIGYTKTPRKRLRQHNGELVNGAWKTHKHRPWEHVCIVSGFPNGIVALQFEWQWQHGTRKTLGTVEYSKRQKSVGYARLLTKLKDLLATPLWSRLDLTVHFLDQDHMTQFEAVRVDAMTACSRLIARAEIDTMHQVTGTITSSLIYALPLSYSYPPISQRCWNSHPLAFLNLRFVLSPTSDLISGISCTSRRNQLMKWQKRNDAVSATVQMHR